MAKKIDFAFFLSKDAPKERHFLSVQELGAFLGVSPNTIYRWVKTGFLKPDYIGDRIIRFDSTKIERWIELQQAEPTITRKQ